jgi:hypothetical protein
MGAKEEKMRSRRFATALVLTGFLLLLQFAAHSQIGGVLDYTGYYPGLQPGTYSMRFALYDAPSGGTRIWPIGTAYERHPFVSVSGGRFTVKLGSQGSPLTSLPSSAYLDVGVCAPAGSACQGFEPLPARLPIGGFSSTSTETPLPAETPVGTESPQVGSETLAWLLAGNAATVAGVDFLGTTDAVPLEIRVANQPVLRLEPNAMGPNVIGGQAQNNVSIGVYGATISGGGGPAGPHSITAEFGTIGGGLKNLVSGRYGTIAGGQWNIAGSFATVGGGVSNTATGWGSTVAGGQSNEASSGSAAVGGGEENTASGSWATVAGGVANSASGDSSFIGGGQYNTASGDFSFAAGTHAKAFHNGTFVWADSAGLDFQSTDEDQFLVRAFGGALFNVGVSRFGMIVSSGRMHFTSPLADALPPYSSFAVVGLNSRSEDDAVGVWGHAGGAPPVRRPYAQTGVLGTSISGYGVMGTIEGSAQGLAAGFFEALSKTGATFAVSGINHSTSNESAGGYFSGETGVLAETDYAGKAVLAKVDRLEAGYATGYAVYAEGGKVGVYGEGGPVWYSTYQGGGATPNPTYGVYGKASGPQSYGVYSEGNSHVEGTLTWTPKKGYVSVGPWAFDTNDWWAVEGSTEIRPPDDCPGDYLWDGVYFASVQLPHGVRLTRVEFHWKDAAPDFDCTFRLRRTDLAGGIADIAVVKSQGSAGAKASSQAILDHGVDNQTGAYLLSADMGCKTWFYGAVIEYEVSEPY